MKAAIRLLTLLNSGVTYAGQIKATAPASLIAYWPLDELSGTAAADVKSGYNGTYSNVTLGGGTFGDGTPAPLFNGSTSFVNIFSAGLAAAFNGNTGTLLVWCKPVTTAFIGSTTAGYIVQASADANNYVQILKAGSANTFWDTRKAGGTTKPGVVTQSGAPWFCLVMTWDTGADAKIDYKNGAKVGSTQTGINTFSGSPTSAYLVIGSVSSSSPSSGWQGYIKHVALWNTALSAAQIAALAPAYLQV